MIECFLACSSSGFDPPALHKTHMVAHASYPSTQWGLKDQIFNTSLFYKPTNKKERWGTAEDDRKKNRKFLTKPHNGSLVGHRGRRGGRSSNELYIVDRIEDEDGRSERREATSPAVRQTVCKWRSSISAWGEGIWWWHFTDLTCTPAHP